MHRLREHSCHSEFNMHCPKVIIDWFMILVSLVLKLFVSSRPFKLEGVLCIYVLLFHDKLKTICYVFSYDINTRLTFIVSLFLIFCLCFFSCYNMVAKFLLSRLCLLCPCFKFFDPSTQCLHIWSRLWWCMSPQKLFFCYHLPTRGRAGVKLGDAWYVSNVSIIFDALCLFLHDLPLWRFYAFSGTNLLTRCHSASSLFFCCFCVSEKLHGKYSWNWMKQMSNLLFLPKLREDWRWDGGGPEAATPQGGAAQPLAAPTHGKPTWSTSWRRPFAYKDPSSGKT
jgi:hypothetical protein